MKRIAVLGAGFAGMEAVVELERQFRRTEDVEILLISDQNYFMFTPLLPQIVSSYIEPRHIVQTVREIRRRRRFRFLRETVRSVEIESRQVQLSSGSVAYDFLIFALGSRTNFFGVPGARENCFDLKTLEDGVVLRERILDCCEHADHVSDPEERKRLLTFVVIGGGYTGVEALAEMRDFLFRYIAGRYDGIPRGDLRLVLLEASDSILVNVHPTLRRHALRKMEREGIEVRLNARVTCVAPGQIEINGSETLRAGTAVWAAGVRAHDLAEQLPGEHDRVGRVKVNEFLQLPGHPEIFVAGDSASAASAVDAPMVAPVAIGQGELAARNIARILRREPLAPYDYVSKGVTVSLGMNDAVVNIGRFRLHGYLAWLLWNAIHLFKLVGLKKQVQVALDWSLGSLFPRDAAIVRRQRSCRLCEAGASAVQRGAP